MQRKQPLNARGAILRGRTGYHVMSHPSLRRKRFRGVWEQRKTEERDFRCFARAKNGARAKN